MPWVFHLGGEEESETDDDHVVGDGDGHGETDGGDDHREADEETVDATAETVST